MGAGASQADAFWATEAEFIGDEQRAVPRDGDLVESEAADAGAHDADFLEGMYVQRRDLEGPLALEPERVHAGEAGADHGDQRRDVPVVVDEPA